MTLQGGRVYYAYRYRRILCGVGIVRGHLEKKEGNVKIKYLPLEMF